MPIALALALALAQAPSPDAAVSAPVATAPIPAAAAVSPDDLAAKAGSNLPKDDYGLVAWCHGAVEGQLELDPIAKADMISIEGKAKVAARAQSDAEMEKDRHQYMKDYEKALAAAERASPTNLHPYGVASEKDGYRLWSMTRQKQPIWRMLDWGMWDANDAGCGEAAKRLYNKASLFGLALKTNDDKPEAAAAPAAEASAPEPAPVGDRPITGAAGKSAPGALPSAAPISEPSGADLRGPQ